MRGVTFASPGTVGAEVCRLLAVPYLSLIHIFAQHAGSHILFAAAAYFGKAVLSIKCKGRGIVFHNKKAQILRALP